MLFHSIREADTLGPIDRRELTDTIRALFATMVKDPDPRDREASGQKRGRSHVRTSLSVLSAVARKWCDIPPICPRVKRP